MPASLISVCSPTWILPAPEPDSCDKPHIRLFHVQTGHPFHGSCQIRTYHQYFFCMGKCRSFLRSCLFCMQRRDQFLTRALGKELAPSNIQVNAIACGVIDTDMNRCFSEEERSALIEEIPAGRMGSPEEVASPHILLPQQAVT